MWRPAFFTRVRLDAWKFSALLPWEWRSQVCRAQLIAMRSGLRRAF